MRPNSSSSSEPGASLPSKKWNTAFAWLAWSVFVLTWLKGFRLPNLWSANLFAFNYSQGFVRRGLVGELARRLGGEQVFRYELFVYFAFGLFFLTALSLGILIRKALRADRRDWGFRVAVLVFAASPGLVFFVHVIGYTDYVGVLFVSLLLLWGAKTARFFALFYVVVGTCAVFSLVHEGLSLLLGPALVFLMICHVFRLATVNLLSRRQWLLLLAHTVLATLLILAMSSLVSLIGVEELERVQALRKYIETHADYPVRVDAFDALQRSSRENLTRLMPWYWTLDRHVREAKLSWVAFAPGALWLLVYGLSAIKRAPLLRSGAWVVGSFFVLASLAPHLFNLVGWDWGRWNAFALLSSFLCLLTLKLYFPTTQGDNSQPWLLSSGVIATFVGLASTTPLFDGVQVQFFPFGEHQKLLELLSLIHI